MRRRSDPGRHQPSAAHRLFLKNPGARYGGWDNVVAPWEVMSRLLSRKNDAGTGVMDQMIVGDYFTNHYEDHVLQVRSVLKRKCDALTSALRESFGPSIDFYVPRGGMYLWVKLPQGVDSRKLAGPALREGIAFNPGPDWSADPEEAAIISGCASLSLPRMRYGRGRKTGTRVPGGRVRSPDVLILP